MMLGNRFGVRAKYCRRINITVFSAWLRGVSRHEENIIYPGRVLDIKRDREAFKATGPTPRETQENRRTHRTGYDCGNNSLSNPTSHYTIQLKDDRGDQDINLTAEC